MQARPSAKSTLGSKSGTAQQVVPLIELDSFLLRIDASLQNLILDREELSEQNVVEAARPSLLKEHGRVDHRVAELRAQVAQPEVRALAVRLLKPLAKFEREVVHQEQIVLVVNFRSVGRFVS